MQAMITPGQTLENPVTGERFTFTDTTASTNGELLAFDFAPAPRRRGPDPARSPHPDRALRGPPRPDALSRRLAHAPGRPGRRRRGSARRHALLSVGMQRALLAPLVFAASRRAPCQVGSVRAAVTATAV
jgi:hypothetical protein